MNVTLTNKTHALRRRCGRCGQYGFRVVRASAFSSLVRIAGWT